MTKSVPGFDIIGVVSGKGVTKSVWSLQRSKGVRSKLTSPDVHEKRLLRRGSGSCEQAGCDKIGVTVDIVGRLCYYLGLGVLRGSI